MRIRFKVGVVWTMMDARIEAAMPEICATWEDVTGRMMMVTSGRDGEHSARSLHYEGRAFDVRTRDIEPVTLRAAVAALKKLLGPNWDVVIEADHVHVELDRRADN